MGMYALAGREPDKRLRGVIRQFMLMDVTRRRDYIKTITIGTQGTGIEFCLHTIFF
jgi:sister chromatid cohesion protein PDS5